MVTYAPSGGQPASGDALRDVLRRTLADGKPQVSRLVQTTDSTPQLGLLLTVPLRHSDGTVRGALAGLVRIGLHSLLPPQEDSPGPAVHAGGLRRQFTGPIPRRTMCRARCTMCWDGMPPSGPHCLPSPNADSRLWGPLLVTRVGCRRRAGRWWSCRRH